MTGDGFAPRFRASRRATLCLALSASIAIAGCDIKRANDPASEFSLYDEGGGIWLIRDRRTTCEYLTTTQGGIVLRSDGSGNVTPNCAGSHGYAKRPDQQEGGQ